MLLVSLWGVFTISKYVDELIEKELKEKDNKIGELRRENKDLEELLYKRTQAVALLEDRMKGAEEKAENAISQNKAWKREKTELTVRVGELEYALKESRAQIDSVSDELDTALEQKEHAEARASTYEDEFVVLNRKKEQWDLDRETMEKKLLSLQHLEEYIRAYG